MNYCYTKDPVEGFTQLNPIYWAISSPRKDAKKVVVDEGFEEIAEHYKKAGADVQVLAILKAPESAEDIDNLKKDELLALLEAQGVESPKGKVDDLRKQLMAVLFPGAN